MMTDWGKLNRWVAQLATPLATPLATLLATLLTAVLVASCGGGGGGDDGGAPPPPPVVTTVIATVPPNGAVDVAPDQVIEIVLSSGDGQLAAADVTITDTGNALSGTLTQVGATASWRWQPDYELPRGSTIRIATKAQGQLAEFVVRGMQLVTEQEVPGEQSDFTLSWPNGRRAIVAVSGRVFEVTASGLVERFVAIAAGARAYGDGDFLCESELAGVHYCVRGNLDGSMDLVATPFGVPIRDSNERGDVVAMVPTSVGTFADWGLWRLLRTDTEFTFAGTILAESQDSVPSIDNSGTVSLAYRASSRLQLSRFRVGDLVGEQHELLSDGAGAKFDSGDDGRGLLAFLVEEGNGDRHHDSEDRFVVELYRYEPGVGLRELTSELRVWPETPPPPGYHAFHRVQEVRVADRGSACVVLASGYYSSGSGEDSHDGITSTTYEVVRVEPDDQFTTVFTFDDLSGFPFRTTAAHASPARCDLWAVSRLLDPTRLTLLRTQPSASTVSTFHEFDLVGAPVATWSFSQDDSGRAVLALNEDLLGVQTMRVQLWN